MLRAVVGTKPARSAAQRLSQLPEGSTDTLNSCRQCEKLTRNRLARLGAFALQQLL